MCNALLDCVAVAGLKVEDCAVAATHPPLLYLFPTLLACVTLAYGLLTLPQALRTEAAAAGLSAAVLVVYEAAASGWIPDPLQDATVCALNISVVSRASLT